MVGVLRASPSVPPTEPTRRGRLHRRRHHRGAAPPPRSMRSPRVGSTLAPRDPAPAPVTTRAHPRRRPPLFRSRGSTGGHRRDRRPRRSRRQQRLPLLRLQGRFWSTSTTAPEPGWRSPWMTPSPPAPDADHALQNLLEAWHRGRLRCRGPGGGREREPPGRCRERDRPPPAAGPPGRRHLAGVIAALRPELRPVETTTVVAGVIALVNNFPATNPTLCPTRQRSCPNPHLRRGRGRAGRALAGSQPSRRRGPGPTGQRRSQLTQRPTFSW